MKLMLTALALMLIGCEPSSEQKTFRSMPPELKDCRIYRIVDERELYVMRCPHSDTSVTWRAGKTTHHSMTVEDQ